MAEGTSAIPALRAASSAAVLRSQTEEMASHDAKSHGLEWSDDARGVAMLVQSCRTKKARDEHMRTLFASLAFAATPTPSKPRSYPLTFFYNRRPVVRLGSPLLLFCDEQLLRNPAWAYVDETWSSERRFSFYEKQRRNRSFARAARATLEARDSLLDPLYVAIFIALAQRLRETRQPSEPGMSQTISIFVPKHTTPATRSNPSTRSRALVTSLTRYTVNITEDYLLKFDDPYHFHHGTLHIYQTSIPIEMPSAIFKGIQEASGHRSATTTSNAKRKRELLCDISEVTVRRAQGAE
ncbi:hypothetical protein ACEPPN_000650 [Leptodophora sp. 'Broadleaf-Isolate-01']